jgi:hypothetical protein
VVRPPGLPEHILDFTYLFHRDVDNPAFTTMGEGRQIREDETATPRVSRPSKLAKMKPASVPIETAKRLVESLASRGS